MDGKSTRKVLVVEDNPDSLRIITLALDRYSYEVISTRRGEHGVELALRERPFFIVMDINLSGIDGIAATRMIRNSEAREIPIIAVTALTMTGDRESILAAGCNGYIRKPFDPITVVDEIHAILGLDPHEDTDR